MRNSDITTASPSGARNGDDMLAVTTAVLIGRHRCSGAEMKAQTRRANVNNLVKTTKTVVM